MDKPMAAFFVARLARVQAARPRFTNLNNRKLLYSHLRSRGDIGYDDLRLGYFHPLLRARSFADSQNRVQKSSANGFNSGLPSTIQPAYLYCAYLSISTNPARSGFRAMYSKVAWNAASVRALSLRTLFCISVVISPSGPKVYPVKSKKPIRQLAPPLFVLHVSNGLLKH